VRKPDKENGTDAFRVIWSGDSETDCVELCRDLQLAGVEYRVSQQPVGLASRMGVLWKFEIGVPRSKYELARQTLGLSIDDELEEIGLEPGESPVTTKGSDLADGESTEAYLKYWDASGAVVKVWSQSATDSSSIVELSLKENLIHYRMVRGKDRTREYFVLPKDEFRAREILRKIEKGEPTMKD
jgi:hypothetical protein